MSTLSSISNRYFRESQIKVKIRLQYYNMMMIFYYICQLSIRSFHNFRVQMKKLQFFFDFHPNLKKIGIFIEPICNIRDILIYM